MIAIAALPDAQEVLSVLRIILDPSENHAELCASGDGSSWRHFIEPRQSVILHRPSALNAPARHLPTLSISPMRLHSAVDTELTRAWRREPRKIMLRMLWPHATPSLYRCSFQPHRPRLLLITGNYA